MGRFAVVTHSRRDFSTVGEDITDESWKAQLRAIDFDSFLIGFEIQFYMRKFPFRLDLSFKLVARFGRLLLKI